MFSVECVLYSIHTHLERTNTANCSSSLWVCVYAIENTFYREHVLQRTRSTQHLERTNTAELQLKFVAELSLFALLLFHSLIVQTLCRLLALFGTVSVYGLGCRVLVYGLDMFWIVQTVGRLLALFRV